MIQSTTTPLNSMISDYFKEGCNYDTLLMPEVGFMMYRKFDEELHISHFYILPEKRHKRLSEDFNKEINRVAKELGCSYLSCIVDFNDKPAEVASRLVRIYLEYGFTIHSLMNDSHVIFKRNLV